MSYRDLKDMSADDFLDAVGKADDRPGDNTPVNGWVRRTGTCFKHVLANPCPECMRGGKNA